MTSRMRALSLTVAAVALLGSAVAVAGADEVKGPVHITSRGVETDVRYEPDRTGRDHDRDADRAARDAGRVQGNADRARAHEIARAARDAAREITRQRADIARAAAEAARSVVLDQARLARDVAHAARDAAREVAHHSRDIARAARDAVESAMRLQMIVVDGDASTGIEPAVLITQEVKRAIGDPLASAQSSLDQAEQDLARQAEFLAAMGGDHAELFATMAPALEQAKAGLAEARSGLAKAQQAVSGSSVP